MPEYRQYNAKRQLIDADDFLSKADDSYIMCISGAMLYALRVMAKTRLSWASTYFKTQFEQRYELPSLNELDQIDDVVSSFIADSEVIEMCNQALLDALNSLSDTVRLSSCCFEGGPGGQTIGDDFYYGTEPPLDEPIAFGPGEEFATEEEWLASKCAVANGIVNAFIGTLNGFSVLTLASLTATAVVAGMVGIGLIFVPPVALLVALISAGLLFGGLTAIADGIEAYRSEIVCALYNSTSATDAYVNFKEKIEEVAFDVGLLEFQIGVFAELVMQMAPIDTMNNLFRALEMPTIEGDEVDCDIECDTCPDYEVLSGTFYPETGNFVSAYNGGDGYWYAQMRFNWTSAGGYCDDPVTVTSLTEISGTPQGLSPTYGYRLYDQTGTLVYFDENDPPLVDVANVGLVNLKSTDATFTVNIVWV